MSETTNEMFPAGVFDLRGLVYESAPDAKYGAFSLDYAELHRNTVANALRRVLDHVSSNESIAPASTARSKDPTLSDEAYAKIVSDTRTKLFGRMKSGEWGEKGATRGPRQVGELTLDSERNRIRVLDTRAMIAKKSWAKGEKPDTWVVGDKIYDLAQMVAAYVGNPKEGPARVASIERRAKAEYEAKLVKMEEAKKARERSAEKPAETDENGGLVL